ncbi:unnamed protein product [Arabidopsis halleri]
MSISVNNRLLLKCLSFSGPSFIYGLLGISMFMKRLRHIYKMDWIFRDY